MGKINLLDRHTAELIAAGEVVERPASAVKELVENSIDSGATAITVEIKNGGNTFIRVTDNGCGIDADDIKKAFLRHATSKISKQDDLDRIMTLGFRGEALASISAVAKVELLTRTADSEFGTKYVIHGGEEQEFEQAGCALGTTIVVRDLFYNTPARRKFLKKDNTESNVVTAVIQRIAVSNPQISFKLIRDSKAVINTPGDNDLHSAVFTVFGREFADSLIPVEYSLGGIRVFGSVCTPTASRKNRAMQFFFLNGRYIRTKTGMAALEQAYKNSIAVGTYPSCVLNIGLDPTMVDVNVHPAKTEVRFSDEQSVFSAVFYAVKSALTKDTTRVAFEQKKNVAAPYRDRGEQLEMRAAESVRYTYGTAAPDSAKAPFGAAAPACGNRARIDHAALQSGSRSEPGGEDENTAVQSGDDNGIQYFHANQSLGESAAPRREDTLTDGGARLYNATVYAPNIFVTDESVSAKAPVENGADSAAERTDESGDAAAKEDDRHVSFRYVGQAFDTYIIVECDKKLILIDKHAAHERILFERLKSVAAAEPQMLLSPLNVTLSAAEYDAVLTNLDRINEAGFDITDFGMNTVRVRSVPVYLDGEDVKGLIEEIAGKLINKNTDFTPEFLEWLFHNVACRAAIKAGNRSTEQELIALADTVLSDDKIRYCPHGRPVAAELSENEIKRRFSRI